ncbi:MAG: hypothetical protein IT384_14365 [Deltaproteobacteria bacterium]|nr:hypothetical protein [Deltaproteobacteria bacterium]
MVRGASVTADDGAPALELSADAILRWQPDELDRELEEISALFASVRATHEVLELPVAQAEVTQPIPRRISEIQPRVLECASSATCILLADADSTRAIAGVVPIRRRSRRRVRALGVLLFLASFLVPLPGGTPEASLIAARRVMTDQVRLVAGHWGAYWRGSALASSASSASSTSSPSSAPSDR